jgi:hypothetical protein
MISKNKSLSLDIRIKLQNTRNRSYQLPERRKKLPTKEGHQIDSDNTRRGLNNVFKKGKKIAG